MRKLLSGPFAWHALDRLEIPGHGTDILRVDFPPKTDPEPMWGNGRPAHQRLSSYFSQTLDSQVEMLDRILLRSDAYLAWPLQEAEEEPSLPWRNNEFFPPLDAIALFAFLCDHRPDRYIEIGSGVSTRVAAQARKHEKIDMEIISVDPLPRAEVAALCDQNLRIRLEDIEVSDFIDLVTSKSVVFFDGSHRCFPGSDVTVFFMEILPGLPSGTIVQIHDIYLPNDYPPKLMNRFWSEQYLLAAYMLGGEHRLRILFSSAYLETIQHSKESIQKRLGADSLGSCSIWLQVV